MKLSAVILAGGASRRMGRDKAWLEVDGQSLLARAVATVRELNVEAVFISGQEVEDYSALGCPVLFDREPGFGPLGGIERGLDATASPLLLVLAVDLPQMTAAFLRKMASHCDTLTGVVPRLNGEWEPLAAIYPRRCHAFASEAIIHSRRAARDFAAACLRERAVRTLAVARADAICFQNWNTPADVAASVPCRKSTSASAISGRLCR